VPNGDEPTIDVKRQFALAREKMMAKGRLDEASWLAIIQKSPGICGTTAARESLRRTSEFARELGFGAVADYIDEFMDEGD